jgi:glucose/arabinose dehydrogenase
MSGVEGMVAIEARGTVGARVVSVVALLLVVSAAGMPVHAADPAGPSQPGRFLGDGSAQAPEAAPPEPASGFSDTVVISGLASPTVIRFAPDGGILVAEKRGRVLLYPSLNAAPTVALDIQTAVHNYWDRGLLGMTIDPAFASNGRIYVLYAYNHILGSATPAPRWPDGCPSPPGGTIDGCVISARLSRFTLTNGIAGAEHVLVEDWCQQMPSHSIGSLGFGSDGYLYASGGEGAVPWAVDYGQFGGTEGSPTPVNPCGDPPGSAGVANTSPSGRGGALRSQSLGRPAGEPALLNGTIIRINPTTGAAAPGNPLGGSASPNRQRIVAYGLRNPFRFAVRPGTSELWIGDVGWSRSEEINRLTAPTTAPVENFGWPCYEGPTTQPGYSPLTTCQDLYAAGPSAISQAVYTYRQGFEVIAGDGCPTTIGSVISGVAFYQGGSYPARFGDGLFFADHSRNCIWAMRATAGLPDPAKVELVVRSAGNPVDLQTGPAGDIFYVDHEGGAVHRLTYAPGNTAPSAAISATPTSGLAPLDVVLDGRLSADANPGDSITYAWDFTDNGSVDATTPTASFTYPDPEVYTARLTVTDEHGASSSTTQTIRADGSAPIPTIDAPAASHTWAVGQSIPFAGSAATGAGAPLPASSLSWTLTLLHCTAPASCHPHVVETLDGVASGSFNAPDHAYPSALEIRLTATSGGVASATTVRIDPKTVDLGFTTTPNGLAVVLNGTAYRGTAGAPTISGTFIIGSQTSVSATTPQILNGLQRSFSRWSDGSTNASRTIAAPATPWATPLGATFAVTSADLSVRQTGVLSSTRRSIAWKVVALNAPGGLRATAVKVKVQLPAKLAAPTFDAPGWSCKFKSDTRMIVCTRDGIAAGDLRRIRFTTVIKRYGAKATNVASVSSATKDVATANNSVTTVVLLP